MIKRKKMTPAITIALAMRAETILPSELKLPIADWNKKNEVSIFTGSVTADVGSGKAKEANNPRMINNPIVVI